MTMHAASAASGPYTLDQQSVVAPLVADVKEANLRETITTMAGYNNRYYTSDTGVAAAGFRLERLATVGAFSLDGIYLEAQIPSGRNRNNLFTGGSLFDPASATPPQVCWYVRLKGRWHAVQLEIQATTNQNDYTLARPTAGSMGSGVPDVLGPGRQGGDAGLPLRSPDYKKIAYLGRIGIPF